MERPSLKDSKALGKPRNQITRNIKTRNGTDLEPFRGTEQQNKERFAMHAGTKRKTTERFIERNGTERTGTEMAISRHHWPPRSQCLVEMKCIGEIYNFCFCLENRKSRSRAAAWTARRLDPRPTPAWILPTAAWTPPGRRLERKSGRRTEREQ